MKQKDLAKIAGWSESKMSAIFHRASPCSVEDSVKLEELTGIDAKIWHSGTQKQIRKAWQAKIRNEAMTALKALQAKRREELQGVVA